MRISDWSSDVCSSDLPGEFLQDWRQLAAAAQATPGVVSAGPAIERGVVASVNGRTYAADLQGLPPARLATHPLVPPGQALVTGHPPQGARSDERRARKKDVHPRSVWWLTYL